mgnify:CR=1 FL=1
MITGILIILSFAVNFILLVYIKQQQEINHKSNYRTQHSMWDDITQIERNVRAIDKKIEDSTIYKTELRFMDNKKD